MSMVLSSAPFSNFHASMVCFAVALMMVFLGRFIWKHKRADLIPRYEKLPGENTAAYTRLTGQAMMIGGAGFFFFFFPLHSEEPNKYFALAMLILCLALLGLALYIYSRAEKARRNK